MKSPIILLLLAVLFVPKAALSQNLNEYKYVIVPMKYDFLSEEDQYQLNSLTAFLFEKYGFTAILGGEEFPADLKGNRCAALTADVISDSGIFSFDRTVTVILKNCNEKVIFKSKEGRSDLKDYKFGYQQALRDAFSSVEALNYSYTGPPDTSVDIKEKNSVFKAEKFLENTNIVLEYQDNKYSIQKDGKTLVMKKQGATNPFAFLNETSKGNYVFRSTKINGTAYFDPKGNLVVEYFDVEAGKVQKMVYARKAETKE